MKVNQRVAFFVATTGFIAIGYFGFCTSGETQCSPSLRLL